MSRGFYISGPALVDVRSSPQEDGDLSLFYPDPALPNAVELGLTDSPITVTPRFRHLDIKVDDFGGEVPPEVLWMLSDAIIRMRLIHFDVSTLDTCIQESMAGSSPGSLAGAGEVMNGHYLELKITAPNRIWTFPTAYLADTPVQWPLGTERSLVQLTWRAIPHRGVGAETLSQESSLWKYS